MNGLIKINDVAARYKITKRSLRFYEEIGLLKSFRHGASQSRYYDTAAINRLEQILLLRSVDFSMDEIKRILQSDNINSAFDIFTRRLDDLNGKIHELNHCKAVIGSFVSIGKEMGLENVNVHQLLKDQVYIHKYDERMINMENLYDGDIIRMEIGLGIVTIITPQENAGFLGDIKALRGRLETETSKSVPLIRIMDKETLNSLQYKIILRDKILFDNSLEAITESGRLSAMLSCLEIAMRQYLTDSSQQ